MTITKMIAMGALILGVSACQMNETATATRAAPLDAPVMSAAPAAPAMATVAAPDYKVAAINVDVPRTLKVSEANMFYPIADIVWRGDAYGDRYEQVEAIFNEGLSKGAAQLAGAQDVVVDVEVIRFHSLTERTRYTVGGTHSITFAMTVRDAKSGSVLRPRHIIKSDLKGFGGNAAVIAERMGQTQKVRITDHLARILSEELGRPAEI
ncbi:MAG: DUF6778 family protein [Paracoccaceae bacterium]